MCRLVMGTRWESSKRPLFVKTVWVDGHHHVILSKCDPLADYVAPTKSRANSSIARVSKNVSRSQSCDQSTAFPNLKVPSVKLLLEGIKRLKKEDKLSRCEFHPPQRPKTVTVNSCPGSRSKKDIAEAESFSYARIKMQLLSNLKASSLDVEDKITKQRDYYVGGCEDLTATKFGCMENRLTSLSERVMVWLDLAIQNGDYRDQFIARSGETKSKKRVITAHHCSNMKPTNPPTNNPDQQEDDEIFNSEDADPLKEEPTNSTPPPPGILVTKSAITAKDFKNSVQISSRQEISKALDSPVDKFPKRSRRDTCKRQLHIFIPNIPKRCNDLDSNLSSKSSSLLKAK